MVSFTEVWYEFLVKTKKGKTLNYDDYNKRFVRTDQRGVYTIRFISKENAIRKFKILMRPLLRRHGGKANLVEVTFEGNLTLDGDYAGYDGIPYPEYILTLGPNRPKKRAKPRLQRKGRRAFWQIRKMEARKEAQEESIKTHERDFWG